MRLARAMSAHKSRGPKPTSGALPPPSGKPHRASWARPSDIRSPGSRRVHGSTTDLHRAANSVISCGHPSARSAAPLSRPCARARRARSLVLAKGLRPVAAKKSTRPKANTSFSALASLPAPSAPGAAQWYVPPAVVFGRVMSLPRPKSRSFAWTPPARSSTSTFEGLKSPWTIIGCRECKYISAWHMSTTELQRFSAAGWQSMNSAIDFPTTRSMTSTRSLCATLTQAP